MNHVVVKQVQLPSIASAGRKPIGKVIIGNPMIPGSWNGCKLHAGCQEPEFWIPGPWGCCKDRSLKPLFFPHPQCCCNFEPLLNGWSLSRGLPAFHPFPVFKGLPFSLNFWSSRICWFSLGSDVWGGGKGKRIILSKTAAGELCSFFPAKSWLSLGLQRRKIKAVSVHLYCWGRGTLKSRSGLKFFPLKCDTLDRKLEVF